jgi:hypothetical protein
MCFFKKLGKEGPCDFGAISSLVHSDSGTGVGEDAADGRGFGGFATLLE